MIRAKFQVVRHAQTAYGNPPRVNPGVEITLAPQYDSSIEEDRRFAKATPSGTMTMAVDNPTAIEQLALGKFFYVDFTEVPADQMAKAG